VSVTDDGDRLREVLARRGELLARLAASPADKPTLVDDLPVARSTVDRGVRDLEEVGCLDRVDGRFRANAAGRAALAAHETYTAATDGVAAAAPVLAHLSPDASLPCEMLVGADVRVADDHAPERVTATLARAVRTADRVRGTAAVLYTRYLDDLAAAVGNGAEVETVASRRVVESARDLDAETVRDLLAHDRYASFVVERDLPYALTLVDRDGETTAAVTVYDRGAPRGVLVNDDDDAVAWAREEYRAVRGDATPLRAEGFGA
jgi:hypothetical protein